MASQSAALLSDILGDPQAALAYAQRARVFAGLLGDIRGHVQSVSYEICTCCTIGAFPRAAALFAEIDLLVPVGSARSEVLQLLEEVRIDFHIQKTEYLDAQRLLRGALHRQETAHPPVRDTALTHINLAFVGIMTGSLRKDVESHLEAVRAQCTTFVNWPSGLLSCDFHAAVLELREGNAVAARPMLETSFRQFYEAHNTENSFLCLEVLADHTRGLSDLEGTQRWACVYLAAALQSKSQLSILNALRCLGTVVAAQRDDETALRAFQVALDGFSDRDVHMGRGNCMAEMAEIFARRGDNPRAKELWGASREVLKRSGLSGQATSVVRVDPALVALRKTNNVF